MRRNWIKNNQGSVFVVVAFSVMAVVGSVGVAVDVGRSQMVQAKLQSAVDAAGLAAGASLNSDDLEGIATKYINLNFNANNLGARLGEIETELSDDRKVLTVSATADVPTTVTKIFNKSAVAVNAATEITRSNKGLEVALVLDTTGSMLGAKLTALQTASNDLVDILFGDEATAENLWVGIVPFSQTVNIGPSRTNWLDAAHYASLNWFTTSWAGCVDARVTTARDLTDDPPFDLAQPNAVTPAAPYQRLRAYYHPDTAAGGINNWRLSNIVNNSICSNSSSCTCANHGPCVTTTTANTITTVSCTGGGNNRSCNRRVETFTGLNIQGSDNGPNSQCSSPITPLTNVKQTLRDGIAALQARGATHINFGAVWGWRLISPRWRGYWGGAMDTNNLPLNYNSPLMSKAVILMTDGENFIGAGNRTAYGYLTDQLLGTNQANSIAALNTKTTAVCNAMKAQGVIVYTILFQQNSEGVKTIMRNCATTPDMFFDSPTSDSLRTAFQTIGDSLANLRISK